MADDIKRNWVAEAVAIVSGESRLIPEVNHLKALAAHAEASVAKTMQIGKVLIAVMVDNDFKQMPVPGAMLASLQGYGLEVEPLRREDGSEVGDGTLIVKVRPPAPATPKARVN